jgi:hypothetical protein
MPIHHDTYAMPNARQCTKESYTYATKELPHTKLTNDRLLEGRQKELDATGKRAKERKTHKLPLNTCTSVGVLDRQPTKGSTRGRLMWPRRDR